MDLDLIEERAQRRGYKTVRTDWNERGDRGYLKVWARGVVRTFTASGVVWPEGVDNAELLGERMTWARLIEEGFPGWSTECPDDTLYLHRKEVTIRVVRCGNGQLIWRTKETWMDAFRFDHEDLQAYLDLSCALAEVRS